jgi:invasion protein IalB
MTHRLVFTTLPIFRRLAAMIAALTVASPSLAQPPFSDLPFKGSSTTILAGDRPRFEPFAEKRPQFESELIFSSWTKFCLKGREANAKQVCFTGKDGRAESGVPMVAAVLIEPENEPKKVLRITLPLGMSIKPGTRVIIDNGEPMTGSYVTCFKNGCMADYDANAELIAQLKKGRRLVVQCIDGAGKPVTFVVPLLDFAQAYDGPPNDPKVFNPTDPKVFEKQLEDRKELKDDRLDPRVFRKSIQQ